MCYITIGVFTIAYLAMLLNGESFINSIMQGLFIDKVGVYAR